MNGKKMFTSALKNISITIMSVIVVIPLLLLVVNSLKDQYQSASVDFTLPKVYHFENFLEVIDKGKLASTFLNSILYAAAPIIPLILFSSMAAFIFARNKTKMNRFLYLFIIMGMVIPTNYVTLVEVMKLTHLMNTKLGLILIYTATNVAFTTFLFYGFLSSVPKDLDEAAIIDGCTPLRMFFQVVLPLLKPLSFTVVILAFMNTWNDFINPLYFTNKASDWPMTLGVYNFYGKALFPLKWNLVCADIILTSLPVVAVYILCQKYIVAGMTMGSVKG